MDMGVDQAGQDRGLGKIDHVRTGGGGKTRLHRRDAVVMNQDRDIRPRGLADAVDQPPGMDHDVARRGRSRRHKQCDGADADECVFHFSPDGARSARQ